MDKEKQKSLEEMSDDEFIKTGMYIDDIDLGMIPLLSPDDSMKARERKERIIDERIDAVTHEWKLDNYEGSSSMLKKIIYDISDEIAHEVLLKEHKQEKVAHLLVRRFREMNV